MAQTFLPNSMHLLPDLPIAAERVLFGLGWLWFINLFNFMDGIDGLAGGEGVAIAAGYLAVAAVTHNQGPYTMLAVAIASGCLGYLFWNWQPAKIFMGDAGSVPLGFLLGVLLIDLVYRGQPAAAIILPLIFVADATITLLRRLLTGKNIFEAHREHFYQRAVLGGESHHAIALRGMATNTGLVVCALLSIRAPVAALVCAGSIVTLLLISHARSGQPHSTANSA